MRGRKYTCWGPESRLGFRLKYKPKVKPEMRGQFVNMKLHGGNSYSVPREAKELGNMVMAELDGLIPGEKITLTFTVADMSEEEWQKLPDFEGH